MFSIADANLYCATCKVLSTQEVRAVSVQGELVCIELRIPAFPHRLIQVPVREFRSTIGKSE